MNRLLLSLLMLAVATANAQTNSPLKGKYFGLKQPGQTAELFAKDIVSTEAIEHSAPAFSREGDLVVWGSVERGKPGYLREMRMVNGIWSAAVAPSFASAAHDDMYPRFSPDGKKLYFSSRRPLPAGSLSPAGFPAQKDIWIWVVERQPNGWGQPSPLDPAFCKGIEYAHSMSLKGNIFLSVRQATGKMDIWTSGGLDKPYTLLSQNINTDGYEDGPFVSPDEAFLIFESDRAGGFGSNDLYISFKQDDGSWGKAVNMGPTINTTNSERFAGLSPDGEFLFFGSDRNQSPDVYWISAKVITALKKGR